MVLGWNAVKKEVLHRCAGGAFTGLVGKKDWQRLVLLLCWVREIMWS